MSIPLAVLEEIIDTSGIAPRIELLLPIGVRRRQLRVRTLLAGMMLSQADHRPAHLTRVHQALTGLPPDEQWGAPSLPDCGPPVGSIRKGLGVNGRQENEFHA